MPLRITEIENGKFTKPVIVCDHCGEEITTATDGNYHWRFGQRGDYPGAPVYFTHKKCCSAFENVNPSDWLAMDLECLFVYLAYGLKLDWNAAIRHTELLEGLG
jgi:hypothetical protein